MKYMKLQVMEDTLSSDTPLPHTLAAESPLELADILLMAAVVVVDTTVAAVVVVTILAVDVGVVDAVVVEETAAMVAAAAEITMVAAGAAPTKVRPSMDNQVTILKLSLTTYHHVEQYIKPL